MLPEKIRSNKLPLLSAISRCNYNVAVLGLIRLDKVHVRIHEKQSNPAWSSQPRGGGILGPLPVFQITKAPLTPLVRQISAHCIQKLFSDAFGPKSEGLPDRTESLCLHVCRYQQATHFGTSVVDGKGYIYIL